MGKKSSKLKQDTIDRLTTDTYCKYPAHCYSHPPLLQHIHHLAYDISQDYNYLIGSLFAAHDLLLASIKAKQFE